MIAKLFAGISMLIGLVISAFKRALLLTFLLLLCAAFIFTTVIFCIIKMFTG